MVKARITLQNLKTLTYNFPTTDLNLAKEFTDQLDQLYQSFYTRLPSEAGLIVLQSSLRSRKRREPTNSLFSTYAGLPPRKKFKSSLTKRVGIKAERKRKQLDQKKVCAFTHILYRVS